MAEVVIGVPQVALAPVDRNVGHVHIGAQISPLDDIKST